MQRLGFAPEEIISVVQGLVVLFIAAPRIIEYLTKTFTEEGGRASKDIHEAAPFFFGLSVALAGTILGIASVTLVLDNSLLLWTILLGAIVGVYAFMKFLTRDHTAVNASYIQALIWFVVAAAGSMMAPMSVAVLFAVLGVLSLVTGIVVRRHVSTEPQAAQGGEV